MLRTIFILAITGFIISFYAYFTETKLKEDASYKPVCDISERISCSKPLQSEYANLFFISNTIVGIIFYVSIAILAFFNMAAAIFYAAIASGVATIYLAYLLYFKVQSLCIVCTSLYVVNALILFFSYKEMFK